MQPDQDTRATSTALADTTDQVVRRALADHARLSIDPQDLSPHADLYALGLTSHATVNVMLAVEDQLDTEFPDHLLTRATFASISAMTAAATEALA
ncbi:acyl carrier protein [Curtobacterium sp. 9128]|uniref:acyl carrier protein n=1 Tax=Curtobacterium sp. 9128 TaxID=1793722 RepID=UPI0011AACB0F|nr:acyl carrier protein [Curtobacterium sp. 9128]